MLGKKAPPTFYWTFKLGRLGIRTALLGCLLAFATSSWANTDYVSIGEPGNWVLDVPFTDSSIKPSADTKYGIFYRLFDRQVDVTDAANHANYSKIEFEFTNLGGVEDRSTITIDFDPNYESIVMHSLGIVRDSVYIDRLESTELEVLRTEEDLDDLFYNGTKTLTLILDDVRVGDILRYSYTRNGSNPVFDNLFEYTARTQFYHPMASVSFRLITNENQSLYIRQRDTEKDTVIDRSIKDGIKQVSWSANNLEALNSVDDEPYWSELSPRFTVSTVANWEDIVAWSLPKYDFTDYESKELETVAQNIKQQHDWPEAQVGAALQWVQEEIRYFGVELGDNSHNPSNPEDTLANRFGDCKDKTVLLISLLSKLGIEAQPALVNTYGTLRSDKVSSRLNAFNHVIVHVELEGTSHWIDPTRRNQRGAIGDFYEPNYGKALIIADGQTELTSMSMQFSEYNFSVLKKYELDPFYDGNADFTLQTYRKGLSAEHYRGTVSDLGLNKLKKDYVDYYRGNYNYLESAGEIKYKELSSNSTQTTEAYKLEEFWTDHDDGDIGFDIVSDETRRYLEWPEAAKYRTRSYAQGHPNIVEETNIIHFANNVTRESAREKVSNEYFTYEVFVEQDPNTNTLTTKHKFESHALSIPAKDLRRFSKDMERAWEISSIYVPKSGLDWNDDDDEPKNDLKNWSDYLLGLLTGRR